MSENKQKPKLPKVYLVLKIVGSILFLIGLILFILSFVIFNEREFNSEVSSMGMRFGGLTCIIFSLVIIFMGFSPSIAKINVKTRKYVMDQNKEDLQDISSMGGDIASPGVSKVAGAVKDVFDGSDDPNSKYCKFCGKKIDNDAIYCDKCGKKQD